MRSALGTVLVCLLWFPSSRFGIAARREPRRSCVSKPELGNEGTESEDEDEDDDEDD